MRPLPRHPEGHHAGAGSLAGCRLQLVDAGHLHRLGGEPTLGGGGRQVGAESLVERAELQGIEEPADLGGIPAAHLQVPGRHVEHLDRRPVGRELLPATEAEELPVLEEARPGLPEAFPVLRRELVEVLEDLLEGAVGLDELGGGLLADARDAVDVVGGVAPQRRVVQVALGAEAVPLAHGRLVVGDGVRDAPAVHHHPDPRPDHLEEVTVGGDDDGRRPLGGELGPEHVDDVVGLDVVHLEDRHGQHLEDLPDQPDLLAELVRRGLPLGLVLGADRQALQGSPAVEGDRKVPALVVLPGLDQHGGEPVHGVGGLAAGGAQVGLRQGEEGTVRERVPVEEEDSGSCGLGGRRHPGNIVRQSGRATLPGHAERAP